MIECGYKDLKIFEQSCNVYFKNGKDYVTRFYDVSLKS